MYSRGIDPAFPYLSEQERYRFPNPLTVKGNIIAIGGNLSPGMLLSAYEQGIFPWYNPEDPILWQSPDPRLIIFPDTLHVSRSMQKVFSQNVFTISFNTDFSGVIQGCRDVERRGQGGTWITDDIIAGYTELNRLGYIYCAESRKDGVLVGGCYGVLLGSRNGFRGQVFCGESMFSLIPNASKAAFLTLARHLFNDVGVQCIDCQVPTNHLMSMGGKVTDRVDFLRLLQLFR